MFYSDTQSFLNFLRILNHLEVGVFARAVQIRGRTSKLLHFEQGLFWTISLKNFQTDWYNL
jgi:hypothetical protein